MHFSYGADSVTDGDITIEAAGSGADDLLALVPQLSSITSPPECGINSSDYRTWVLQQGLALVCQFVGHETSTGQNLLDWWGGGFEFAVIDSGGFRKMSNILHTFWHAVPAVAEKEFQLKNILKFMKYDYFDDALVIQTLEYTDKTAAGQSTVKEHGYWIYPSLLKGIADYDLPTFKKNPPTFDHQTISSFVFIDPSIADIGHLTRIHHDPSGDRSLEIERLYEPDRFQTRIQPQLWLALEAAISEATGFAARHE
jgi:hypothetical protein